MHVICSASSVNHSVYVGKEFTKYSYIKPEQDIHPLVHVQHRSIYVTLAGAVLFVIFLCTTLVSATRSSMDYEPEFDYYPEYGYEPSAFSFDGRGGLARFGKPWPRGAFVKRGQFLRLG
ncbi:unnamed protein product [Echinostoma caproni]|uniref:Transmembrane protein n=1 Tax=Echinostoma caproni TaxID=27848 RepID=A0A183A6S2_9TREM|nr:unnamed protein product [Echinostoma caproni]